MDRIADAPPLRPSRARDAALGAALFLVVLCLYGRGLNYPLLLDDEFHIRDNSTVHTLRNLPRILWSDYWETTTSTGNFRPFLKTAFALQYALWGDSPAGYRVVNIIVLCIAGMVLVRLAGRLGLGRPGMIAAAGVYLLHPAQVEVVHNAVGLGDIACAALMLAVLGIWIAPPGRPRISPETGPGGDSASGPSHSSPFPFWARDGLVMAGLAFLALGFKETALIVLPLLAVLIPWRRWAKSEPLLHSFGALGLAAAGGLAYLLWRQWVLGGFPVSEDYRLWPPQTGIHAITLPLYLLARYAALTLWPGTLVADWRWLAAELPVAWWRIEVLSGLAMGAGLLALVWRGRRDARGSGAALWLFGLAPFLQLVLVNSFFAERHLSLSLAGAGLLLGWGVDRIHAITRNISPARFAITGLLFILAVSLAGRGWSRIGDWRDGLTLWESGVRAAPRSAFCLHNYGVYVLRDGRIAEAREAVDAALAIEPIYADAWRTRGEIAMKDADYSRAEDCFRRALRLAPRDATALVGLGFAALATGQTDQARAAFENALAINPALEPARRGMLLLPP